MTACVNGSAYFVIATIQPHFEQNLPGGLNDPGGAGVWGTTLATDLLVTAGTVFGGKICFGVLGLSGPLPQQAIVYLLKSLLLDSTGGVAFPSE